MKYLSFVFFMNILSVLSAVDIDLNHSVVQIYTSHRKYDYESPWDSPNIIKSGGSGFVIAPNLVMTNAHLVADTTFLEVRLNGYSERYSAKAIIIGHDCDLALVFVEDPEFSKRALSLEFEEEEVSIGSPIVVAGYPLLFENVSLTKGIVSRNQVETYLFSGVPLYCSQIDAPINPGNSGGPVFSKNGKVAGIVFQSYLYLQNLGFMIPISVIEHFLRDAEKGHYTGFPVFDIEYQSMENPYMRKCFGMDQKQSGVLITNVGLGIQNLQEKDILLSIEKVPVMNDGLMIHLNGQKRLFMSYLVSNKYVNDVVKLEVLRDKEKIQIEEALSFTYQSIQEYDTKPSYYIFGGLVFQPITMNYLQDVRGYGNWLDEARRKPKILLTRVLPDIVNIGYHDLDDFTIKSVNDQCIYSLNDLIKEIEKTKSIFIKIEAEDGKEIILHKQSAQKSNDLILKKYDIQKDRVL